MHIFATAAAIRAFANLDDVEGDPDRTANCLDCMREGRIRDASTTR